MEPFPSPDVRVLEAGGEWQRAAAGEIVRCAKEAAGRKSRFTVALAGGETPRPVYELLASHPTFRQIFPWKSTHFFWSDERCVPPDDPQSNFRMVQQSLLAPMAVPPANIHRMAGEIVPPAAAAEKYEQELRAFFRVAERNHPRLDLIVLGLGADGHTASLLPNSPALNEQSKSVMAVPGFQGGPQRITLTLPVINHAAVVVFLVNGEGKADAVRRVLRATADAAPLPAQLVHPGKGRLIWILDRAAAKLL